MDGTIVQRDPTEGTAVWEPLERAVERLARERRTLADLGLWRKCVATGAVIAAIVQAPAWLLAAALSDELILTAAIWAGVLLVTGAALLTDIDRETVVQRARTAKWTEEVQRLLAGDLLEP